MRDELRFPVSKRINIQNVIRKDTDVGKWQQ